MSNGNNGEKNWIGFDLGGTKMLATIYDHKFKKLGKARKKTKGREGMEAGLKPVSYTHLTLPTILLV